jgi:hypothetical protein
MGFFALQASIPLIMTLQKTSSIVFYGRDWKSTTLYIFTALTFGCWALAGAKWKIGEELLEGSRIWRIPGFIAYSLWYQLGFENYPLQAAALLTAMFCYFVGVLNSEPPDYWRRWLLKDKDRHWLDRMPAWVNACLSFIVVAVILTLIKPRGNPQAFQVATATSYYFMQACFLTRDLTFLQWCRFSSSRKPEITALIFICLAYALPAIILSSFKVFGGYFFFAPVPDKDTGVIMNLFPGLMQAIVMIWIFVLAIHRRGLQSNARRNYNIAPC